MRRVVASCVRVVTGTPAIARGGCAPNPQRGERRGRAAHRPPEEVGHDRRADRLLARAREARGRSRIAEAGRVRGGGPRRGEAPFVGPDLVEEVVIRAVDRDLEQGPGPRRVPGPVVETRPLEVRDVAVARGEKDGERDTRRDDAVGEVGRGDRDDRADPVRARPLQEARPDDALAAPRVADEPHVRRVHPAREPDAEVHRRPGLPRPASTRRRSWASTIRARRSIHVETPASAPSGNGRFVWSYGATGRPSTLTTRKPSRASRSAR